MPSFRSTLRRPLFIALCLPALATMAAFASGASSVAPPVMHSIYETIEGWLTNSVAGSAIEGALFRQMDLPTGSVMFPRTPAESTKAITALINAKQNSGELYALRAVQEEQALQFSAAQSDWIAWVSHAPDHAAAELDLAHFYGRRLQPNNEVAALEAVAKAPNPPDEKFMAVSDQRSWQAFDSLLNVIQQFALSPSITDQVYSLWITRYPDSSSVYSQYFDALLATKRYSDAAALIAQYSKAFPADKAFPIQAAASLAYHQSSVAAGLAIYDKAFDPLWPSSLIQSYYSLLQQSNSLPAFIDQTRATLAAQPDNLNAAAKLFFAWQQQSHSNTALQVIARYRRSKQLRHAAWTAQELYTFATLLKHAQFYPQAARFYFALYNSTGMPAAKPRALSRLISILLTTPNQPLRLGEGNLSLYRDIATMDQGPGYLNGILSLLLNDTNPSNQYSQEAQPATPYFERAEAARLLTMLDQQFPTAPERAQLHADLISTYAAYGEDKAVIEAGQAFLAEFPHAPQRISVALTMTNSYAGTNQTAQEFSLYQKLLRELATQADGVPLGDGSQDYLKPVAGQSYNSAPTFTRYPSEQDDDDSGNQDTSPQAFATAQTSPVVTNIRSPQYEQVLDSYLSLLVSLHRIPQALQVLRGELQHDPDDPGIYSRLAKFFEQNQLGTNAAEVYQQAIQQFNQKGWYAKLARFYLREKRDDEYLSLTEKVAHIFDGTGLESYLQSANAPNLQLSLEINLYAHNRFPHDLTFVRNLINIYDTPHFQNQAGENQLLAQYWFASDDLRNQFFDMLASQDQLDTVLASLEHQNTALAKQTWSAAAISNPAATLFYADANIWQAHFATALPAAAALANAYPANVTYGAQAASLYRSLAYFHPEDTARAVAIDKQLFSATPDNLDLLARIGDTYADKDLFADAAPYWVRMGQVYPGDTHGYLQAATVFWDYFDYKNALAELNQGRLASGNSAQYSYQEGAIYENQQDYPAAIAEYVRGAITDSSDSQSSGRLLDLAHRPKLQKLIEHDTASLLTQNNPSAAEINLRANILSSENKQAELSPELSQLIARTTSLDTLNAVASVASANSLVATQQQALQREISLTKDPTRRLQLKYNLLATYENNDQLATAQSLLDAIYQAHPKILGVVRATVDFDWSNHSKQQAITVLEQAAASAYPSLAQQFRFELAHKLIDTSQYPQARSVLATILQSSPLNMTAIALTAQTFARAGDNKGLTQFDQSQIAALEKSSLSPTDRKQNISALRRGLIPALTRLGQPAGAIDQYIELLKSYPEDTGLTSEAALYAKKYQQQPRLLDYFNRAVLASPRNPHWPIIVARLQTTIENYPAAITADTQALVVRPNRVDLHTARAALYETQQQYDNAIADYEALYHLTYQDPSWMVNIAEDRAREGKPALATAALETAFITGRIPKPENFFTVAQHLASWNMLNPALQFASRGVKLAGNNFLADPANHPGAALYASILVRLGKPDQAYAALTQALADAGQGPGIAADIAHSESAGIDSVLNSQWHKREQKARVDSAHNGFANALKTMAETAHQYDTPEQTAAFVSLLQAKSSAADPKDIHDIFLPAARAGKLTALVAHLQWQLIQADDTDNPGSTRSWADLERRRLLQQSAAKRLEQFAPKTDADSQGSIYIQAANLYGSIGDSTSELRCLNSVGGLEQTEGAVREIFFSLLLKSNPQKLISFAAGDGPSSSRNAAAQFAVLHASPGIAQAAIAARAQGQDPVWDSSYTALNGLYRRQTNSATNTAFQQTLGIGTIAEQLAHPVDHTKQLAGDLWFYYGARYGEYLELSRSNSAEDYLPASLESAPRNPQTYEQLAAWYKHQHEIASALAEYDLALQLTPHDPLLHNQVALLLWSQNQKQRAIAAWRSAVDDLDRQMNASHVPGTFGSSFATVVSAIGAHGQLSVMHGEFDTMLRHYIAINGTYMTMPLLDAIYKADGSTAAATHWILDLAISSKTNAENVLYLLRDADWITPTTRPSFDEQLVTLALQQTSSASAPADGLAQDNLRQLRIVWLQALLKTNNYTETQAAFSAIPASDKQAHPDSWLPIKIRLAAHNQQLAALIAGWQLAPANAPASPLLSHIATMLDATSRDQLMAYVYETAIASNDLSSPNFLGLAAIRIRQGKVPAAVSLLNRLTLVSSTMYADIDSSGSLLYNTGHFRTALPFLQRLVAGQPWNATAHLHYDLASLHVDNDPATIRKDLAALASDPLAPYATRTLAARSLADTNTAGVSGSVELQLLARGNITFAEAQQPYFIAARMAAAATSTSQNRISLLRQVIGMAPANLHARITLLHASINADQSYLVLNTAQPLITTRYDYDSYSSNTFGPNTGAFKSLPAAEQATLHAGIAAAYRATGQLADARANFKTAARLDPDAANRKSWRLAAAALQRNLIRSATNTYRAPQIHSDLSQNHPVWPRLVPTSMPKPTQPYLEAQP